MASFKINVSYDSSVTTLQTSNPTLYAQLTSAIQTAVQYFQNVVTTPITVNINFGWGEAGGSPISGVGASSTFQYSTTYTALYNAVKTTETTSAVQSAAVASLPTTDPTNGATFSIATAEALALGFNTQGFTIGGSAGLSSSTAFSWTQTSVAANTTDAIGTLEHEISEVLGRSDTGGQNNQYTLLDMFRYTAANGLATNPLGAAAGPRDQPFVAGYNANAPSYFSYNGSTTTLLYETPANVAGGADVADWAPSVGRDAFGDGPNGGADVVSATDLQEMNVLGYSQGPGAPSNLSGDGVSDLLMTNSNNGSLVLDEVTNGRMTYQQVGGLGAEWQFAGVGAFLPDGMQDELLWNSASGGIVAAEDVAGTMQYTQLGAVGSEWKFGGTGAFLGPSAGNVSQPAAANSFLLLNSNNGGLYVGSVANSAAQYTQIGGLGSGWNFEGTGNYLNDGKSAFLIYNANGSLDVGEVVNGAAQYTAIGGLGSGWQFVGSGNFTGTAQTDFMILNSNGSLYRGQVTNGAAQYTQLGGLGPEWQFFGTGNYDGSSAAEFILRNSTTGGLVIGAVSGSTVTYTQVGGVGSEWNFHTNNVATVA